MENSPETSPEFLKKLWKIFFIFQQIEKGWTVKKKTIINMNLLKM